MKPESKKREGDWVPNWPKGSSLLHELKRDGPKPASETEVDVSLNDRTNYDVRTFELKGKPQRTVPVVYIGEYHSQRDVLLLWFETNRELLERVGVTRSSVANRLSGPAREVWKEVRDDELDWLPRAEEPRIVHPDEISEPRTIKCPKCDRPCQNLPRHIRSCDGGDE